MALLHYFVHGNGRGHATRTLAVLPRLRADDGHEVRVFAGGQAVQALRDAGEAPRPILGVPPGGGLFARFARRFAEDRYLLAERPALVVTDGDGPSMHAARSLGIPCIAVGHGLLFAHCKLPLELPLRERAKESLNARSASWLAQRCVVSHFGVLEPSDERTTVARPDPRGLSKKAGKHLLVYGGRADLSEWVHALHARGHRLRVFGRARELPSGVPLEAPGAAFTQALESARGIVGTAGSNLVSEAAQLGTALLALYPAELTEQRVNALLAERDGFAVSAPVERVDLGALERFESLLAQGTLNYAPPALPTVSEAVREAVRSLLG